MSQKWNLGSILRSSGEAILISFVMLTNEKRHFVKKHDNRSGAGFRLNDDPSINLSSVGQCLMIVFGWAHCGSTGVFI